MAGNRACGAADRPHSSVRLLSRALSLCREHGVLVGIVVLFIILATIDNLILPPFEAADEHRHYAYVRHLAQGQGLPAQDTPVTDLWSYGPFQEASQPPLYYFLAALATGWIPGADDVSAALRPNPNYGYPAPAGWADNKNFWLRSPAAGRLNRGFLLSLHVARAVSTCLGAVAVVAVYGLGLVCFDENRQLAAWSAAWMAFNPEFVFVSGAVSNDSATAGLAALALWMMALWVMRGPSLSLATMWGVTLGVAALAKASLLSVFPVCALGTWMGIRKYPGRGIRLASVVVMAALSVGAWWYVRGAALYGDPLGVSQHLGANWTRTTPSSLSDRLSTIPMMEISYWAGFGWGGVERPWWLGQVVTWWVRLGLLGVAVHLLRSPRGGGKRTRMVALLIAWLAACLLANLWWMGAMKGGLGRLMLPAAAAIGVLLVRGWISLLPHKRRTRALRAMTSGLMVFAIAAPPVFVFSAYARPRQLSSSRLAVLRDGRHVTFGGAARLLHAEVSAEPTPPKGWMWVDLCWESVQRMERDYEVFVHLVGAADSLVAVRHTQAGLGRFPTSRWEPGDAFCDKIRVKVAEWAPAPAVYDVEVGLHDPETGSRLEALNQDSEVVSPVFVGRAKVRSEGPPPPAPQHPAHFALGDQIVLTGYSIQPSAVELGGTVTLTLHWRAERKPGADYLVFVHVLDGASRLVAQNDGAPRDGSYPTSWWDAGETVTDPRRLVLPADAEVGSYRVAVGMYEWPSMARLPVTTTGGPVPDGVIDLTSVRVTR